MLVNQSSLFSGDLFGIGSLLDEKANFIDGKNSSGQTSVRNEGGGAGGGG